MLILDTDVVSLLHAGHPAIVRRLTEIRRTEAVATTIITRIEVLRGRFDFLMKADAPEQFLRGQRALLRSEENLKGLPTLPLTPEALERWEQHRRTRAGKKIGRADLLIACIALAVNATLVTQNLRHFRLIPQLRVENWVD